MISDIGALVVGIFRGRESLWCCNDFDSLLACSLQDEYISTYSLYFVVWLTVNV